MPPGVRAIVPTLAGLGRMHPVPFAAANGLGALLWAVGTVLLGYAASSAPWVRDIALWAMAVSIAVTITYGLVHITGWKSRRRDERTSSPYSQRSSWTWSP
jgi:membrane-associated protein